MNKKQNKSIYIYDKSNAKLSALKGPPGKLKVYHSFAYKLHILSSIKIERLWFLWETHYFYKKILSLLNM